MFEKILSEKSEVKIEQGRWEIDCMYSDYNQVGSKGRDDLIRRQDAIKLLGDMNIKLASVYADAKEKNPQLADELLQATSVLSYAMWGIREMESTNPNDIMPTELANIAGIRAKRND